MDETKLYAVIDIGAHSIKMIIGEKLKKKGLIKIIENLLIPIAIGNETFKDGVVSNNTIDEIINILYNFKQIINSYKIQNYYAIATSSIREAGNSEILIERVYKMTGIHIEVIENIDESRILHEGMRWLVEREYNLNKKNSLFFSISAGSTEIILEYKGKILFSETHHLGTLKIVKDINFSINSLLYKLKPYANNFLNSLKRFPEVKKINYFVCLNEDVLNILKKEFNNYLDNDIFKIPKEIFNSFCMEIGNINLEKIQKRFDLNENFTKTTLTALFMLNIFLNAIQTKNILMPNINFALAYLINATNRKKSNILDEETKENIISAAIGIGRKYQYDEEHALQVRKLALQIFDQMRPLFNFNDKERIYLEVACLLHDIGIFVSPNNHNKNSAKLIESSEILGFQNSDLKIVAQIARYHRKSPPKQSHTEYMNLPMESRLIVSKLAAIIRIADALDNLHNSIVENIKLNIHKEFCELILKLKDNKQEYIDILRSSVQRKSDMFENFFGIPVKIEREI